MPLPVRGSSTPVVSQPTNTTPTAPAAPATPTAPAAPAGPVDVMTPSRVDRLKGKAIAAAWDEVANAHDVGTGVSFGAVSGNVKISEEIGVRGTDTFKNLVANDRRRNEVAQANPDAVWVKTTGALGTSVGLPLGHGASLGFSGGVEVTSIAAQDVKGARDVVTAVKAQAKSMVLPLDAEGLAGLKAEPGSEWMFRGTIGASVGVGVGTATTLGGGNASVTASVGASVGASASSVYTKNVKVLEDGKVFVAVGKQDAQALSASVGVNVGANLNTNNGVANALGGGAVGNNVDRQVDRLGNKLEDATRITSSLTLGASAGQKVMGAAVLDLNTVAGREAYDYLLKSNPEEAAAYMQRAGIGLKYNETSTARSSAVSLQFGNTNLLATSTYKGTTNGTVEQPGSTTTLSQADYARSVGGLLPRLLMGEERSVQVRAGALTKDGATERAVAVSLGVKDRKLTQAELAQAERFAKAMGMPFEGLPTLGARETAENSQFQVTVALTDAHIDKLRGWGEADVRFAFAAAHKEIDGNAQLPLWHEDPQTFAWYEREVHQAQSSDPQRQDMLRRDYQEKYGRNLGDDIDSSRAIDRIVKQLDASKGKPVDDWGKLLESVGKQSSGDVRASVLALRRLSGAEVVAMSLSAKGVTAAAKPEAQAPKTIADVVGPLLAPPA
ncbi:MAG: hypothetical protein IT380_25400 [Myxococcales bacterium]|nr:hypothetical protein [Myxococcales bacterium]